MAHYAHSLVYVRFNKSIRVQDIGPVQKGDTAALTADAAERLSRYGDVTLLKGKALAAAKRGEAPEAADESPAEPAAKS